MNVKIIVVSVNPDKYAISVNDSIVKYCSNSEQAENYVKSIYSKPTIQYMYGLI